MDCEQIARLTQLPESELLDWKLSYPPMFDSTDTSEREMARSVLLKDLAAMSNALMILPQSTALLIYGPWMGCS